MNTYGTIIIFPDSYKDEKLDQAIEGVSREIERCGGSMGDVARMGRRTFARPMKKKHSGVYVRVSMSMDASRIDELLARFKLNEDVFRVQVLKDERSAAPDEEAPEEPAATEPVAEAPAAEAPTAEPASEPEPVPEKQES